MNKFREGKFFYIVCNIILKIIKKTNLLKDADPDRYECINCNNIFDVSQQCQCGGNKFLLNSKNYEIKTLL